MNNLKMAWYVPVFQNDPPSKNFIVIEGAEKRLID
jgi:hypothetical protein